MPRTAAELARLPHDTLAALLSEALGALEERGLTQVSTTVNAMINIVAPLPEQLHSEVLLSNDLLTNIFSHLAPRDVAAASACSLWAEQWKQLLASWRLLQLRHTLYRHFEHVARSGRQYQAEPTVSLGRLYTTCMLPDGRIFALARNHSAASEPGPNELISRTLGWSISPRPTLGGTSGSVLKVVDNAAVVSMLDDPHDFHGTCVSYACAYKDAVIMCGCVSGEWRLHRVRLDDGTVVARSGVLHEFFQYSALCIGCGDGDESASLYSFDGETLTVLDPDALTMREQHTVSEYLEPLGPESVSCMVYHKGALFVCYLGSDCGTDDGGIHVLSTSGARLRVIPNTGAAGWRNPQAIAIADDLVYLLDAGEVNPDRDGREEEKEEMKAAAARMVQLYVMDLDGRKVDTVKYAKEEAPPPPADSALPQRALFAHGAEIYVVHYAALNAQQHQHEGDDALLPFAHVFGR